LVINYSRMEEMEKTGVGWGRKIGNLFIIALGAVALFSFTPLRKITSARFSVWQRQAKCYLLSDFNLCGRVMGQSSSGLLPDSPLKDVFILAIPESSLESLLGEKTFAWLKRPEDLMFVISSYETFEKNVIQVTKPQPNGIYVLNLPVGYYLLCLANMGYSSDKDSIIPASVVGCLQAQILSEGQTTLDIHWGSEGIVAP